MTAARHHDPHAVARRVLRDFWTLEPRALEEMRSVLRDQLGNPDLRDHVRPPLMPPGFAGLTCGARTRSGSPCKSQMLWPPSYRCRYHGGWSGLTEPHAARACARVPQAGVDDALDEESAA